MIGADISFKPDSSCWLLSSVRVIANVVILVRASETTELRLPPREVGNAFGDCCMGLDNRTFEQKFSKSL